MGTPCLLSQNFSVEKTLPRTRLLAQICVTPALRTLSTVITSSPAHRGFLLDFRDFMFYNSDSIPFGIPTVSHTVDVQVVSHCPVLYFNL